MKRNPGCRLLWPGGSIGWALKCDILILTPKIFFSRLECKKCALLAAERRKEFTSIMDEFRHLSYQFSGQHQKQGQMVVWIMNWDSVSIHVHSQWRSILKSRLFHAVASTRHSLPKTIKTKPCPDSVLPMDEKDWPQDRSAALDRVAFPTIPWGYLPYASTDFFFQDSLWKSSVQESSTEIQQKH